MERKYFGVALVLLNIANGNKGAQEKAQRIEAYLIELTNALIEHTLYEINLEPNYVTTEKLQDSFVVPTISG